MIERPTTCHTCRLHYAHHGFCKDFVPEAPKIAIVLDAPDKDAVLEGEPLVGNLGEFWLDQLIRPLGHEKSDILVAHTIRCKPPAGYPKGTLAKHGLALCRQYDTEILAFDPNLFLITEHPKALFKTPAMTRYVQKHIEKAFKHAAAGWRVCVLMGAQAMTLVAPELAGGVQKWHGHWFTGGWPGSPVRTVGGFRRI